nr:GNAT family N-acetyltransferase [Meiothermus sp.]
MPTLNDIRRELDTLRHDTRRQALLLMQENRPVGFLDYKVAYPDLHSATISLLLIEEKLQGQGLGKAAVEQLEAQLSGRMEQLYAVVYGNNEQAKRFWERVGFEHLRDSGPTLSWYMKSLK